MNIYKIVSLAAVVTIGAVCGGVPPNNLQGAGGIAFNPLAYSAGQPWEGGESNSLNNVVSKPQVGAWYINNNLSLVAAYVQTGDKDKFYRHGITKNLGAGSGLVFSVQYQF